MPNGRVLEWTALKGYGVILGDDGSEAFVHHAQIATPGFKNLVGGQRVTYDVKSEPRGDQAINVVPLPKVEIDLSPEEWGQLEPRCAAGKLSASSRNVVDGWDRPQVVLLIDLQDREKMFSWIREVQGALKAGQPKNPVFIVDFQGDEGYGIGWCAVGADSAQAAESLVKSKLPELLEGTAAHAEIVETMTLAEYEEEQGRVLPRSCYPKPGEVVQIG
jgi:CspA family cold shock protein